ncbi:DUF4983 domain-containing protein [Danxiaibacter flavus]|uniref:DUF4983 domain-containing protein n=1 Tax=Danxiaibacter flavus TaxID=3049108 RepID=A0ABV3ZLA0_9BACT|nr:DUF4983 domain-containing protein [Chitinophagaceae bacterium DXS]
MKKTSLQILAAICLLLFSGVVITSCSKQLSTGNDKQLGARLSPATALAGPSKKVLILGIDGCRQDVMMASNTPNIKSLLTNAVYSLDALTLAPTWSGNGWSTMLTGVTHLKHRVTDNNFTNPDFTDYPNFLKRVEAFDSSKRTISIAHWASINQYIIDGIDQETTTTTDLDVKNAAVASLTNDSPDVLFMAFDDVDHAGHTYGFSPSTPQYVSAIETTDGYIGQVLTALRNRPNYANEDWLIICSPDHGATDVGHGGESYLERNIFTIFNNRDFPANQIASKTFVSESTISGNVVNYNSTKVYASVSNSNYDFGQTQDFTIECRVKSNGFSGDPAILANKDWNSGNNKGFVIAGIPGGSWKVNIGDGTNRADLGGNTITDGKWHHLSVSFTRGGTMKAYQDGVLVGQTSIANVADINSSLPLVTGQDGTKSYSYTFNGQVSEVRVWKAALDSTTIVSNCGTAVTSSHPFYSSLTGYWKGINETTGYLADSGPKHINMPLSGKYTRTAQSAGLTCYRGNTVPMMVDIAYSALSWLGVPISPAWTLDGRSWLP